MSDTDYKTIRDIIDELTWPDHSGPGIFEVQRNVIRIINEILPDLWDDMVYENLTK